jgi:hypothetical protein
MAVSGCASRQASYCPGDGKQYACAKDLTAPVGAKAATACVAGAGYYWGPGKPAAACPAVSPSLAPFAPLLRARPAATTRPDPHRFTKLERRRRRRRRRGQNFYCPGDGSMVSCPTGTTSAPGSAALPGAKSQTDCLTPEQAASRFTEWLYQAPAPMRESASTGFPDLAAMTFVSKKYLPIVNVQTSTPFPYAFAVYAGYLVIQRPGLYKLNVEYARMVQPPTPRTAQPCAPFRPAPPDFVITR